MKLLAALKSIALWSYERGTWQYDVLCLLILAFIFLTPSGWFHRPNAEPTPPREVERQPTPPRPSVPASAPPAERSEDQTRPAPALDK